MHRSKKQKQKHQTLDYPNVTMPQAVTALQTWTKYLLLSKDGGTWKTVGSSLMSCQLGCHCYWEWACLQYSTSSPLYLLYWTVDMRRLLLVFGDPTPQLELPINRFYSSGKGRVIVALVPVLATSDHWWGNLSSSFNLTKGATKSHHSCGRIQKIVEPTSMAYCEFVFMTCYTSSNNNKHIEVQHESDSYHDLLQFSLERKCHKA